MGAPLLELEGLCVKYGTVEALHGVHITVEQGEIVTLLGANGAGKSTTLRAISGLLKPSAGEIRFDGKPAHTLPAHELVKLGIAQAPEGRRVFGTLTVRENLALGRLHPHRLRRDRQDPGLGRPASSPCCRSGAISSRARSPAASSRCSPSGARSWRTRACSSSTSPRWASPRCS